MTPLEKAVNEADRRDLCAPVGPKHVRFFNADDARAIITAFLEAAAEDVGARLTEADTKSWHLREDAHYNGGEAFFAYSHRCIEQPRLVRYDRYERKGRSVTSTWKVDGIDHPSLASAVEAREELPPLAIRRKGIS